MDLDFLSKIKDGRLCPVCGTELIVTSKLGVDACYYQCPECLSKFYYSNGLLFKR